MNTRSELHHAVGSVLKELGVAEALFAMERPDVSGHGDYATNAAFSATKVLRKPPMEIAEMLAGVLRKNIPLSRICERIEPASPGFVNFFLSKNYLAESAKRIAKEGAKFGKSVLCKKEYVNIEFVSANPTGPLTLANGRGGFLGDVLGNVLKFAGARVDKEYYVNDAGNQIRTLGESVLAAAGRVPSAEHHYQGGYVSAYAEEFARVSGGPEENAETLGRTVAGALLDREIKPPLKRAGIVFDRWTSEYDDVRGKGLVEKALQELEKRGYIYERDGASWLKTSEMGDEKDRVLVKSGDFREYTYVAVDIPYHIAKWKRGYTKLVNIWGADHHGDIKRLEAGLKMLEWPPPHVLLIQMVRLMEHGQEIRMSKRTGLFVTLAELFDEVGVDVARFFFLMREPNTHMDFDLALAKEHSQKNPVYYVQYAHARLANIQKKAKASRMSAIAADASLLVSPAELALISLLLKFPEVVEDVARTYEVHRLPQYAGDLATAVHRFYDSSRIIGAEPKVARARLLLVNAAKGVLKNLLGLMGVSAPEQM